MINTSLINLLETEHTALREVLANERRISERKAYMSEPDIPEWDMNYHVEILHKDEADLRDAKATLEKTRSSIARYIKEILAEFP